MNLELKSAYLAVFALILMVQVSCKPDQTSNLSEHKIIPNPAEIKPTGKVFRIHEKLAISITDSALADIAVLLSEATNLPVQPGLEVRNGIVLSLDANRPSLGAEGYVLSIDKEAILVSANNTHGVFNGVQTLVQLMPGKDQPSWIATGQIVDYPRYEHRGSMLDVSRHFFNVEEVKRYIDFLASYKMNVLHLHLTDDQGWRIEIKSRPELTKVGGSTEVGGGPGGFYTQQQYQEIVSYAADRFITIIPEIDMPGHTQAALASYPELNCDGQIRDLYSGTEVGFSTLCTQNEETYEFVDAVIGEIAAITPGNYIHIGGDESHVTDKEDYVYFINRVQKIVSKHGKIMIGWDEIARCSIETNTVVQQWNSAANAKQAAQKGNKIILSPATHAYLDMKYDSTTRIGLSWASLIEVDKGYSWDPDTLNKDIDKKNILGIEAPLWTETVENMNDIEYLVFPRLPGYAEIGWSPMDVRSWQGYSKRLAAHAQWFEERQINYYRSSLVDWEMAMVSE